MRLRLIPSLARRSVRPLPRAACAWLALALLPAAPAAGSDGIEFFEKRIRPVLVEHCYECHGPEKQKGGLRLDSKAATLKGGESGEPSLVPGSPESSLLLEAIRHEDEDFAMPPKKKLPDAQIADFEAWIRMGAPDPRDDDGKAPASEDAMRNHWAFRSPKRAAVPDTASAAARGNHPVDRFVRAKLEAAGIPPAPPASERTRIRRATYDLHGLVPTPQEVEDFLNDESPDAWERLLDRLLASPRFGERWGRHWLDLARYADTKGFVYADRMEKRFVHSAPYRDWVIQAFHEDLPYDRFLQLQIAADQMECRPSDQAATGFLTLGRWLLGVMPDIIDDRIDTLTRTTQALTVSCARCHDHKHDPIPTRDYYSLFGVFSGSTERLLPLHPVAQGSPAFQEGLRQRQQALEAGIQKAASELATRTRSRLADYLAVQPTVDDLPGDETYIDLRIDDLVPAMARRWQTYLSTRQSDPLWVPWFAFSAIPAAEFAAHSPALWREMKAAPPERVNPLVAAALGEAPPSDLNAVAALYGRVLSSVPEESASGNEPPGTSALREALYGESSPCRIGALPLSELAWYLPEKDRVALGKLEADVERWIWDSDGSVAHTVLLSDRSELRNPRVFRRGSPQNRGAEVPRQYLEIIEGADRKPFTRGSGRLDLAEAITRKENPLTARVMVNRMWQKLFGEGLVRTPSDFGTHGDAPTHPELLDWLSLEFIERGWSMKAMLRLIMTSETYQQAAENPAAPAEADPENQLAARQNRRRMDVESLRDSLLFVSGELDFKMGGPPEPMFGDAFSPRRTVYGYLDRQFVPAEMATFDMASLDLHTAERHETTVAPQALFLMNGQFLAARARALAERIDGTALDPASRVRKLYSLLFQRAPSLRELDLGVRFANRATGAGIAKTVAAGVSARNGVWQRVGGELVQTSPDIDVGLFFGDPSWEDYTVEVEACVVQGKDGPQVAVRATGPREMYWAYFGSYGGDRHGAARESGEKLEDMGPPGPKGVLQPGRWYRLKVEMRGEQGRCFIDGQQVYEFKDKGYKHGRIGLGAWGSQVRYRNLKVTDRDHQVLFLGLPEPPGGPLTSWERYAQVLLLSNEFHYID
jgi:mono/diheme cytochrome c family protein